MELHEGRLTYLSFWPPWCCADWQIRSLGLVVPFCFWLFCLGLIGITTACCAGTPLPTCLMYAGLYFAPCVPCGRYAVLQLVFVECHWTAFLMLRIVP